MTAEEDISPAREYIGYARDIGIVAGAQVAVSLLQFIRLPAPTKALGASVI